MKRTTLFSVLSLFLLVPALITRAQTISSQKGLTTIVFNLTEGNIKIRVPNDIRPGDKITGTMIAEPAGYTAKQVKKNLAELVKYSVSIEGNKYALSEKTVPFIWQLQTERQPTALVEILDAGGASKGNFPYQLTMKDNVPASPPEGCTMPSHALTAAPLPIKGSFDGNSSNTNVSINNQLAEILAESPRICFVTFPEQATGMQTVEVKESGKEPCEKKITVVKMDVSAPKTNLRRGEKTTISVQISGLQNLPDTAVLTLRNKTTGSIILNPSNKIVIALEPDSVKSGTYARQFEVQSISTGDFLINIKLDLPETGNDIQYSLFCDDKCSPVGTETNANVGEVAISSSAGSNPDAEATALTTAKYVVKNGELFGATGNEDAALDAMEKSARTRGYVIWVKPCWYRCVEGTFCDDWKYYCGAWIPVVWVDGLENSGNNTFTATGGHTASGEGKVEGKTRKELLDMAWKIGNGLIKWKK